ncbi:MAG: type II toxin-antitoxin system HigB family toxin, partial [Moorea sp. SIO2B7]|nr:type II toxin-antitoxin system HigB family toxin [Moorena sp. SIO2B7]
MAFQPIIIIKSVAIVIGIDWYRVASKKEWQNLADIQVIYKSAEAVGNFTVFNIKG